MKAPSPEKHLSHATKDAELVTNYILYKEFLAEREEILRHKWLESEKAGQDIGFVGKIDRVDTGVLTHVAQDYIPVIASVGADR